MKLNSPELQNKIISIINSCETLEQWYSAKRMFENMTDIWRVDYINLALILGIKYGLLHSKNQSPIISA